jgi:hypothetical protein
VNAAARSHEAARALQGRFTLERGGGGKFQPIVQIDRRAQLALQLLCLVAKPQEHAAPRPRVRRCPVSGTEIVAHHEGADGLRHPFSPGRRFGQCLGLLGVTSAQAEADLHFGDREREGIVVQLQRIRLLHVLPRLRFPGSGTLVCRHWCSRLGHGAAQAVQRSTITGPGAFCIGRSGRCPCGPMASAGLYRFQ